MPAQTYYKRVLIWLVTALLALPILAWLLVGMGALLEAMGDQHGRVLFVRLAVACIALWVMDLVGCVVVLALETFRQPQPPERPDVGDGQSEQ